MRPNEPGDPRDPRRGDAPRAGGSPGGGEPPASPYRMPGPPAGPPPAGRPDGYGGYPADRPGTAGDPGPGRPDPRIPRRPVRRRPEPVDRPAEADGGFPRRRPYPPQDPRGPVGGPPLAGPRPVPGPVPGPVGGPAERPGTGRPSGAYPPQGPRGRHRTPRDGSGAPESAGPASPGRGPASPGPRTGAREPGDGRRPGAYPAQDPRGGNPRPRRADRGPSDRSRGPGPLPGAPPASPAYAGPPPGPGVPGGRPGRGGPGFAEPAPPHPSAGGPPAVWAPPLTGARGKAVRHGRPLWKRLHLPYAVVLALLFPLMLVWPYMTEVGDGREAGLIPPEPRPVAVGETAVLAGSEWRVTGYITGFLGSSEPPPEGLEILDVGFRVTPGDEGAAELLRHSCAFRAVDDRGRSWERTHLFSLRDFGEEAGDGAYGCTTAEGETVAPGREQSIILSFLVPADAVEGLRYEVTVDTSDDPERPRPEALVFEAEVLE